MIPLKTIVLDENSRLGLHIRKKRLERRLLQKDVAKLIGVSEDSITFWESERAYPQIKHFPKIIEFLGYNPFGLSEGTLGGRIRNYRILRGLSHKKFGKLIGVDATTVGAWEAGKSPPSLFHMEKLKEVLREQHETQ